jgi:DNA repair photolyase
MSDLPGPLRGHGTRSNPPNRFEPIALELDGDTLDHDGELPDPRTVYYRDSSRSALTTNQSPDVPFETSLNPYRGCVHACPYCYARPTHEYLGLSAGLDFETKIFVKEDAPELLRAELAKPGWKPQVIAVSGVTDAYQPIERRTQLTRRCLEVLAQFRNPVGVITKSQLVTRDADVLGDLARFDAAAVTLSITTLDPDLARVLEPRAAQPKARLAAVEALARAGIPVGVNVAPVIPALNDHEIPAIVSAAADAGARWAGFIVVRLPHGVAALFERWLEDHYPARKARVLSRIRAVRAGRLNDPTFGSRMRGTGVFAEQIQELMALARRRAGLAERGPELSAAAFRSPARAQLSLF